MVLVRDIMSKDVKVVRPDSSVKEVVADMNKFNIGSVVVVEGGKPVGVISERDILRRVVEPCLEPEALTARQLMTSPVVTIKETATVDEAAKLMAKKTSLMPSIVKLAVRSCRLLNLPSFSIATASRNHAHDAEGYSPRISSRISTAVNRAELF